MRSAFAQFLAFPTEVEDNKASMVTQLTMPVLAIGGEQSFGANEAVVMRNAATNVTEVEPAIDVPDMLTRVATSREKASFCRSGCSCL